MRALAEIHQGLLGTRRTAWVTSGEHRDSEFCIADSDSPEVQVGALVYIDYEPQDQWAKIVQRPGDVSPGGLWQTEHGSRYWVPKVIADTLADRSWHNDACPSFQWAEDRENHLTLWVECPMADQREIDGERFTVIWSPEGCGDPGEAGYEEFKTDDCAAALAKMTEWRARLAGKGAV